MNLSESLNNAFGVRLEWARENVSDWDNEKERVYVRGQVAFLRFDPLHVEGGLKKLFKDCTPEELFTAAANPYVPAKGQKGLYLEAKDFDHIVRFAAYLGGAKTWNPVKHVRGYKTLLPIPLQVFLDALIDELRVYDKSDTRTYNGRLLGAWFDLETVKDILYRAGVKDFTAQASSIKTLLRFCGIIETKAYDRNEMKANPEAVRMIRRAVLNHK